MLVYTIDWIYELDLIQAKQLKLNLKGFQTNIDKINYLVELKILKLITY